MSAVSDPRTQTKMDLVSRKKRKIKRQILLIVWSALLAFVALSPVATQNISSTTATLPSVPRTRATSSTPLKQDTTELSLNVEANCTPPSIDDFPQDIFTNAERQQGWIAVHFLASIYVFYAIAIVCDEFFVPSIECICESMHIPTDVAGATFMAVATSAPELFTNVIGTFVTRGDIGVGTIVGSAVFNILAVASVCGMAARTSLPLEWYPLTRDCLFYSISVILLIVVLGNGRVYWYEAAVLVGAYLIYIIVMYKNSALKKKAEGLVERCGKSCCGRNRKYGQDDDETMEDPIRTGKQRRKTSRRSSFVAELTASTEKTPLLGDDGQNLSFSQSYERLKRLKGEDITAEDLDELLIAKALHESEMEEQGEWKLFSLPQRNSLWTIPLWILSWPARFVLTFTIPDCREPRWRSWYILTFLMCIVWIAVLSYFVSWMMTIIGHTLGIPDSVMGLTFLAAGTSVPEAVSSYIVARQGLGTMSISNSIGSNTFDILMCLGLPWLIRCVMIAGDPVKNYIQIQSGGLAYSAMILMASLLLLYATLAVNKFYLDKKVGVFALLMYATFLVFASLTELNVFGNTNLPTCAIVE